MACKDEGIRVEWSDRGCCGGNLLMELPACGCGGAGRRTSPLLENDNCTLLVMTYDIILHKNLRDTVS